MNTTLLSDHASTATGAGPASFVRQLSKGMRSLSVLSMLAVVPGLGACDRGLHDGTTSDGAEAGGAEAGGEAEIGSEIGSEDGETPGGGSLALDPFFACSDRLHPLDPINDVALRDGLNDTSWSMGYYGYELRQFFGADGSYELRYIEDGVEDTEAVGTWAAGDGQLQLTTSYDDGRAPTSVFDEPGDGEDYYSRSVIRSTSVIEGNQLHGQRCGTSIFHRVGAGVGLDGTWVGRMVYRQEYRFDRYEGEWLEALSIKMTIAADGVALELFECEAGRGDDGEYFEFDKDDQVGTIEGNPLAFELQLVGGTYPDYPDETGSWTAGSEGYEYDGGEYDEDDGDDVSGEYDIGGETGWYPDDYYGVQGRLIDDRTMVLQDFLYTYASGTDRRGNVVESYCTLVGG